VALLTDLGVEAVIDRRAENYKFWKDEHTQDESEWRRFGKDIRGLVGGEPRLCSNIRVAKPWSVGVRVQARGIIVTCAATSDS